MGKVVHQLLLPPAAWLACALDRRLASASVSSKAIIAILSKTRPIARMVLLPVRLFVRPMQKRPPTRAELARINNNIASAWPWAARIRARGSTGSDCKIRGCRRSPPAHTFLVGWQSAIVVKGIAADISARAPWHLSGLADAKVEQHCHRYGPYDEH